MVFEVTPEPFDGIECGTIRGQKDGQDIGWPAYGFGFVPGPIIEYKPIQDSGKGAVKPSNHRWNARRLREGSSRKKLAPVRGATAPYRLAAR